MGAQERPTVLVVEDHSDTRDMLRIALETEGYHVVEASDGVKLLPMIRQHLPNLILLDIMMPWVDGFELCRAIKDNPDLQEIPIVFLSAKTSQDDIETGLQAGAADYLKKPIDLGRLFDTVREHIDSA